MTPEDLWIILDTERRTANLQRLPDNFIYDFKTLITECSNGEEERAMRRKVVNLVQRRQGKIVQFAINNGEMPEMLSAEQRLFTEIREACKTFEEAMLKEFGG